MEHQVPDPLSAGRRRRVLITGAGGQLGPPLQKAFGDDDGTALPGEAWDVASPPRDTVSQGACDLVLHAAAWTDVDGAEADPQGATAVNVGGTANVAEPGAPLVSFSTDYVFDGPKRAPYLASAGPNPRPAHAPSTQLGQSQAQAG